MGIVRPKLTSISRINRRIIEASDTWREAALKFGLELEPGHRAHEVRLRGIRRGPAHTRQTRLKSRPARP